MQYSLIGLILISAFADISAGLGWSLDIWGVSKRKPFVTEEEIKNEFLAFIAIVPLRDATTPTVIEKIIQDEVDKAFQNPKELKLLKKFMKQNSCHNVEGIGNFMRGSVKNLATEKGAELSKNKLS